MNIPSWAVILFGILIIAIIAGAGWLWAGKSQAISDRDYARAERDSVINAKVFTDSVSKVEIVNLRELLGRKPAIITIVKNDTVRDTVYVNTDTVASLAIDTTLQDTGKVYQVPFKAQVDYYRGANFFLYDFQLGTIKETKTIHESNVYSKPAIELKPTFWQKAQYGIIGAGIVALVLIFAGK